MSIAETGESIPDVLPEDVPEPVVNLREVLQGLSVRNLQECYNDAVYYRDEMRQLFITGRVTLRQRTLADKYFWAIINRIAEEKEKNTMRTLMLCNVTGGEFLAAKTLAVLAGTLLVDTVLFFLTGFGPAQLPVFLLVCTAGSITMLLLGGLTGIVCRDQTSTGTIAGPLALVFMLPTMFAGMGGVLQKVASFVPTTLRPI